MAAGERCDQRQQSVEAGGQVDVHVDDDVGLAGAPHGAQRQAAPLAVQVDHADPGEFGGQVPGHLQGPVRTGVVGHGDAPGERQLLAQARMQGTDTARQRALLVVDGYDDLDGGQRGVERAGPHRGLELTHGTGPAGGLGHGSSFVGERWEPPAIPAAPCSRTRRRQEKRKPVGSMTSRAGRDRKVRWENAGSRPETLGGGPERGLGSGPRPPVKGGRTGEAATNSLFDASQSGTKGPGRRARGAPSGRLPAAVFEEGAGATSEAVTRGTGSDDHRIAHAELYQGADVVEVRR